MLGALSPGFMQDDFARRLVDDYAPAEPVPAWPGLEEGSAFDAWISAYARFIRNSFIRRDVLQGHDDPAEGFGRWPIMPSRFTAGVGA